MTPEHRTKAAPPEGRAWQPDQRWNDIRWDGDAVVKRITRDDAQRRRDLEVAMLTRLAGVGRCLEEAVRRYVVFMRGCGEMLRALHAVDTRSFADVLIGAGASVIHADAGPYNMIVDPQSGELRALIDWELARIGDPIEDLALVEWNMRIWWRSSGDVLRHLYDAYGSLPEWSRRHAAMIERCRGYYASSRDEVKREQLQRTEAFQELC